jgi:uncharacterized membrane protein
MSPSNSRKRTAHAALPETPPRHYVLSPRLSAAGLLTGTLFFAFSLTPGLVPRDVLMQGVLSGVSFAAGYGAGVFMHWLWSYLELPRPGGRRRRTMIIAAALVCGVTAAVFLWLATGWQNSVRTLMGMEPLGSARPISVGLLALFVAGAVLALARLFRRTFQLLSRRLQRRLVPRRISNVLALVLAAALFWAVLNGVVFRLGLRAADASFQQLDALIDDGIEQPQDPGVTGSAASLVTWRDLGRQGREFVSSAPSAEDLSAFLGHQAPAPVRVYVGLNSAPTPQARARLALEELERMGAFERAALILITPTGTGRVDPGAIDSVEYLLRGDVASVAVQYSYLPSPLSLLVEADYGAGTARALFDAVYGHWRALAPEARPALYLHGLSLGALNSDLSLDLFDVIGDPPRGALWSGPPFRSETWRSVTARRDTGSPAWLPRFRDGSVVRFANQNGLDAASAPWGAVRIVYLQYASDPITFFEPRALYRRPAWMSEPRGPDVSPALRWFPIVTMLQLAADMAAAPAPNGFGHNFAAAHYIDAWLGLIEPAGWGVEDVERLKEELAHLEF